jgi:hypothetical protein
MVSEVVLIVSDDAGNPQEGVYLDGVCVVKSAGAMTTQDLLSALAESGIFNLTEYTVTMAAHLPRFLHDIHGLDDAELNG